jgi:hypothetical protein
MHKFVPEIGANLKPLDCAANQLVALNNLVTIRSGIETSGKHGLSI